MWVAVWHAVVSMLALVVIVNAACIVASMFTPVGSAQRKQLHQAALGCEKALGVVRRLDNGKISRVYLSHYAYHRALHTITTIRRKETPANEMSHPKKVPFTVQ